MVLLCLRRVGSGVSNLTADAFLPEIFCDGVIRFIGGESLPR
jgi:hypothetical protein